MMHSTGSAPVRSFWLRVRSNSWTASAETPRNRPRSWKYRVRLAGTRTRMTRRLTMLSRSKVHRSETRRPTSDAVALERLSRVGAAGTGWDRVSAAGGGGGRSPPQPSVAESASIEWMFRRRIRNLIPVPLTTQVSKGVLKIGHFRNDDARTSAAIAQTSVDIAHSQDRN